MTFRIRSIIALMLFGAGLSLKWAAAYPGGSLLRFVVYLAVVLLSSGMKVTMPRGNGTASVNFPFVLLGVVQLSPGQAMALAALSIFAQCRIKVLKPFTLFQIAFNVSNAMVATAVASFTCAWLLRLHVELVPALSIAVLGYFVVNTASTALVIGWSQSERPITLWRREFLWYLPFYLVGASLAAVTHLISVRLGWTTSLMIVPVVYTIYRAYQSQRNSIHERQLHLEETEDLHLRTIEGLAMAIEAKDQNTHDHLLRVRVYVGKIGGLMGLDELQMKALLTASLLHDIGKLAVPEHIINKPGKLTLEEFEKMKIHPVIGADMLERVRFPYPVVPIVRWHHEAWDGTGYPDGLRGNQIPIGARILAVVDCFDALASERPYRRALPLDEAMALVRSKAGTQFDPKVVEVLQGKYVELEVLARSQAETLRPLMTEVNVSRGAAPGAGFQQHSQSTSESPKLTASLSAECSRDCRQGLVAQQTPDIHETLSAISARLRRLIPNQRFTIYLKVGDLLSSRYSDGDDKQWFSSEPLHLGQGISGWVAQHGMCILNGNAQVETSYLPDTSAAGLVSALSLPLFDLKNEVFAVMTLYSTSADSFSNDHLLTLQAIEPNVSLSLQHALCLEDASLERDKVRTQLTARRAIDGEFMNCDLAIDALREQSLRLAAVA